MKIDTSSITRTFQWRPFFLSSLCVCVCVCVTFVRRVLLLAVSAAAFDGEKGEIQIEGSDVKDESTLHQTQNQSTPFPSGSLT